MPQLDYIIFSNQILWFFIYFFFTYFVFLKYIVPILALITKFAKKEMFNILNNIKNLNSELIIYNENKTKTSFNLLNIFYINQYLIKNKVFISPVNKLEITKYYINN
jgi:hypothetical protein